jgi:hypothetical protein
VKISKKHNLKETPIPFLTNSSFVHINLKA